MPDRLMVGAGGIVAAALVVLDAGALVALLGAAGVVVVGMRTAQAGRRLAPLLVILVGLAVVVAAAGWST